MTGGSGLSYGSCMASSSKFRMSFTDAHFLGWFPFIVLASFFVATLCLLTVSLSISRP